MKISPTQTMVELLFNLPDDQLAEILIERPDIMHDICVGLSIELYEREKLENFDNSRMLH